MTHTNATQQKHDPPVSCVTAMLRGRLTSPPRSPSRPIQGAPCLLPSPNEMSPAAPEEHLVLLKTFPYASLPRTRKTLHIQANEGCQYFSCLRITSSSPNPSPVCVAHTVDATCHRSRSLVSAGSWTLLTAHRSPFVISLLDVLCFYVCVPTSLQSLHMSHVS